MHRIFNPEILVNHGNVPGRKAMIEILKAELQVATPYNNTKKAMRLVGKRLLVGNSEFESTGDLNSSDEDIACPNISMNDITVTLILSDPNFAYVLDFSTSDTIDLLYRVGGFKYTPCLCICTFKISTPTTN